MRAIDRYRQQIQQEAQPLKPARERILDAVDRACSKGLWEFTNEFIAEAARTSRDVVAREFGSPDRLIAKWLEGVASAQAARRKTFIESGMNEQKALRAWIDEVVATLEDPRTRGCKISQAALRFKNVRVPFLPSDVARKAKAKELSDLVILCRRAEYKEPFELAYKLMLVIEGARVWALMLGESGPIMQAKNALTDILNSHPTCLADGEPENTES